MLRGRCHVGGYSQVDRPELSSWNLRLNPAVFHAPAYPIPEKKRYALQTLPLAPAAPLLNITQVPIGDTEVFRGIPEV